MLWGAAWNDTHTHMIGHNQAGPVVLAIGPVTPGQTPFGVVCVISARDQGLAEQWCWNLPHVTKMGFQYPLPLNERKELLLELIEQ